MSHNLALHKFSRHADALNQRLAAMLWHRYKKHSPLQPAFCALMLSLEPGCKIRRLYDALPFRSARVNLVEFKNTMANLGYGSRTLTTQATQIDKRLLPCLFVIKGDVIDWPQNPYILFKIEPAKERLTVYDAAKEQARHITFAEAEEWGTVEICTFYGLQEDQQPTSKFIRSGTGYT